MQYLTLDTETNIRKRPFVTSFCTNQNKKGLLYTNDIVDFTTLKSIAQSPDVLKIFHNAVFDIFALSNIGVDVVPPYTCTMIMSSLIDENFSPKGLKKLAKAKLKRPQDNYAKFQRIKNRYKRRFKGDFSYDKIPKEVIEPYAVDDAINTKELYEIFEKDIWNYEELYSLELDLIPVVVRMVKRGILIDRTYAWKQLYKNQELSSRALSDMYKISGRMFNPDSAKQLIDIFKRLNIHLSKRTESGQLSTDNEVISKIDHPLAKALRVYKKAVKQVNTYYEPLLNAYTTRKDRVAHFTFYQSSTKTGRFSADLIQTIPKEAKATDPIPNYVRRTFVPRKGYMLVMFDYDQIEMRLFAHMTNCVSLIEKIKKGFDPHDATAIDIFGVEAYEANKKDTRRVAKTINFGIIYGMGITALAESLGITMAEAQKYLQAYYRVYPVQRFLNDVKSQLYKQGFIRLDWIDRIYRIPRALAYKGPNALIQGSAAYVIKKAMMRIDDAQLYKIHDIHMLLQVHDELIFEIPIMDDDETHTRINKIRSLMEDTTTFKLPLTVSIKYSKQSWFDKKTYEPGQSFK